MKSKKVIFLLLGFQFYIQFLFGQDSEYQSPVIPPSPTSVVFTKYGDYQPSLSSGTINIPIPLYEIRADNFTLPFSLLYATSGINFMDQPCPMGYGWSFLPGLRITRTILGRPDDRYPMVKLSGSEDYETLKPGIISRFDASYHDIDQSQLYDTQNDIFTISLPSGNHTFIVDEVDTGYKAITLGNLLRINILDGMSSFEITDDNGVVYFFGDAEIGGPVSNYIETTGEDDATTAWMLRSITLPNGSKIDFTWKSVNLGFAPQTATPIQIKDFKNDGCAASDGPQPEIMDFGGIINYYTGTNSYLDVKMLEKVVFPSGEIDISYKTGESPFMTKFEVKDKSSSTRKQVEFIYGDPNPQWDHTLLKSLKIDDEIYTFTYNSNRFSKNTTSLDYWGYYNGKNNTSLIPRMRLMVFDDYSCYNYNADVWREVGNADRSVDDEAMKAFMLTRIDYPTGGYSEFEYEPHHFTDKYPASTGAFATTPAPLNKGGGLRVTKITAKADASASATVKTYKYGENEDGLAHITAVPTLDTFIDEMWHFERRMSGCPSPDFQTFRMLIINALSSYNKYSVGTVPIWYSKVTEYVNDQKTEYKFDYFENNSDYALQFKLIKKPFIYNYHGLFQNGPRMTEINKFRKEGQVYIPNEKNLMSYDQSSIPDFDYQVIPNMIIDRKIIYRSTTTNVNDIPPEVMREIFAAPNTPCLPDDGSFNYNLVPYKIISMYYRLNNKKTITFNQDGTQIEQLEEYSYNTYGSKPSKVSKSISKTPNKMITEYKYPPDYTDPIYVTMKKKNMLATVVEEITYNGLSEIKRVKTNYTNSEAITGGLIRPSSIQSSYSGVADLRTEITFDKYDAYGNILQRSLPGNLATSYLWSYNYQYPVAEIKNTDYANVTTALNGLGINAANLASNPNPDDVSLNALKQLKTALPNAFVSLYRYKPLVGMTESTDPTGLSSYYLYDDIGRLVSVKDNENNRKVDYAYNYKGSTAPMQINVPAAASYMVSSSQFSYTFSATVTNNIGKLTYSWYLRDPSGTVIASVLNQASNTYTAILQIPGTNTLTCIAKDNFTGHSVEIVKSFLVNVATEYRDVQKTGDSNSSYRHAYATIYFANPGVVHFSVNCSRDQSTVYVKLGPEQPIQITDSQSSLTRDVSFPKGWSYVDLSIDGYDPAASVDVTIGSVSGGNITGGNTILYLWP